MTIHESKKEMVAALENVIQITKKMGVRIERFEVGDVKVSMPKEPNINHIGIFYAGSLFSLADYTAGVLFCSCFDLTKYYPILKEATILYRRPVTTDVSTEVSLSAEEIAGLKRQADATGKAECVREFELKDESGTVCCVARGIFQVRKA